MNGIDKIERFLSETDCKWTIRHVEECRSTNEEILKIIQNETELASKGVVLISNWQSQERAEGARNGNQENLRIYYFLLPFHQQLIQVTGPVSLMHQL